MKKGFTLVEVLAVFVILGIIIMITVFAVNGVIQSSKEKAYDKQIELLTNAARSYMVNHSTELPTASGSSKCVSVDDLQKEGLLEKGNIKNPKERNSNLNGGILVSYNGTKYSYEYKGNGCN